MRMILSWLAGMLLLLAVAQGAWAQSCWPYQPPPVAPDACGPGYYCTGQCGMVYGPNHCLYPGGQPFNGFVPELFNGRLHYPNMRPGPSSPMFPTHPYARSPRDYFMLD